MVAANWGPPALRLALVGVAIVYLSALFFGATGASRLQRALPQSVAYFTQIAKLFPRAAIAVINYRAEGWLCAEERFVEIDVRPHFPIHADDKESRFSRALFFHRRDRPAMQALDAYLSAAHNARLAAGEAADDLPPGQGPIGGVRFVSVREAIPELGTVIEPFRRKTIEELVGDPQKECPKRYDPADAPCVKRFFWTRPSHRAARCAELLATRPKGQVAP